MSPTDDPIKHVRRFADLARQGGRETLAVWADKVLASSEALAVIQRLQGCGAHTLVLLELAARYHGARSQFDAPLVEFSFESSGLERFRHVDAVLLGEAPRRPSDPPDALLRSLRRPDDKPRRGRAPDSEEELEYGRGAIVGRVQHAEEIEPGAPAPEGSGRRPESTRAVVAVLVASHIRAIAPGREASLAAAFLAHVVLYRDPYSSGDEVRAERERIRRQRQEPWVRRRVACLAEILDLPVALD